LEPDARNPAEFRAFVDAAIRRFREVVKIAQVEPQ
jgi:hypothetical protein